MEKRILITGGAGFIGSHLADELLAHGYEVRLLDNLTPQVHDTEGPPDYLSADAELIEGDIRDPEAVERALEGVDAVVHLAARVGVGQSMYKLTGYTDVNSLGTAVLLEALVDRPVERLLVASSMSVYGEGLYRTVEGRFVAPDERSREQLERAQWELVDLDGRPLEPVPTPEDKKPSLSSVYALTKYDQERLCLLFGSAYSIPVTALRFFNTYGPRQALSNPYTGALAIFAARLLNGRPPIVYEDGGQTRDFVGVSDVARACRLALESDRAGGQVVNIGSGRRSSILDIAAKLASALEMNVEPELAGKSRTGDIRHCFADISRARELIGYEPQVTLEAGMAGLAEWLRGQSAVDRVEAAAEELSARGLTI